MKLDTDKLEMDGLILKYDGQHIMGYADENELICGYTACVGLCRVLTDGELNN